jgi:hypothetical protein
MKRTSPARRTGSILRRREGTGALSPAAWERVLERRRKKLLGSPTRSDVFGLAGLQHGRMWWLRRQPDLRMSVVAALAKALGVSPGTLFDEILEEQKHDRKYERALRRAVMKALTQLEAS